MDPAPAPLPDLVLWRSDRCHLCADTEALVALLLDERSAAGRAVPRLAVRRIAEDRAVERELLEQVPVLEAGGRRLLLAIRLGEIRAFVDEACGEADAALTGTAAGTAPSNAAAAR